MVDINKLVSKHYLSSDTFLEMIQEQLSQTRERYEKTDDITLDKLQGLIKEVNEDLQKLSMLDKYLLSEQAMSMEAINIAWNGIPELGLSELNWGSPGTPGDTSGEEPATIEPSYARKQLQRFMDKIGVGGTTGDAAHDISTKLRALEGFFSKSEKEGSEAKITQNFAQAGIDLDNPRESIAKVLGYLTFYKTLTKILVNFNASAAGFTFEAFLAVLLGGQQIPTGEGTIADLVDATGKPISLKLLSESNASIEGSFRDLVNDFVDSPSDSQMEYIVCLKDLGGEAQSINGLIKFYRFAFDFNTFLTFMTSGQEGSETMNNVRLPMTEIATDSESNIDAERFTHEEDVEEFMKWLNVNKANQIDPMASEYAESLNLEPKQLKNLLDLAFNTQLILKDSPRSPMARLPRKSDRVLNILNIMPEIGTKTKAGKIADLQQYTYNALKQTYLDMRAPITQRNADRTKASVGEENYASVEDSLAYLQTIKDYDEFFNTLTKAWGYINKRQWALKKSAMEAAGGQYLGRLWIGREVVAQMANLCRKVINIKVYEIFQLLKQLVDLLHAYFAEGMQSATGEEAIDACEAIGDRTADFEKEAKELHGRPLEIS
jgi:hypothetical protein